MTATRTRRPAATIRIPRRLAFFISGTGWYQGERHPGDNWAELDRMAAVIRSGKVARDDAAALRFLRQEADWLWSCSDDSYDPGQRADRAAASRFMRRVDEELS